MTVCRSGPDVLWRCLIKSWSLGRDDPPNFGVRRRASVYNGYLLRGANGDPSTTLYTGANAASLERQRIPRSDRQANRGSAMQVLLILRGAGWSPWPPSPGDRRPHVYTRTGPPERSARRPAIPTEGPRMGRNCPRAPCCESAPMT